MIVLKVLGGFASQIGKFAYAYTLANEKGVELVLDISEYLDGYFRPLMLEYLNLPKCRICNGISGFESIICVENGLQLVELYERKDFPDIYLYKEEIDYQDFFDFYPQFKISDRMEILDSIELRYQSNYVKEFAKKIEPLCSVAVHIRRGDFVQLGWEDETEMYMASIGHILCSNPDAHFFFFSNDIEWVKKRYGIFERFHFIEKREGNLSDIEDFFCLSMCKYKILSSMSGFSRYAHYLGLRKYNTKAAIICSKPEKDIGCEFLRDKEKREGLEFYRKFVLAVNYEGVEDICKAPMMYNKNIIFVSKEPTDKWKWNNLIGLAKFLSGYKINVLYIKWEFEMSKMKSITKPEIARDMDGTEQGFHYCTVKNQIVNVDTLVKEWKQFNTDAETVVLFDVPVKSKYKGYFIRIQMKEIIKTYIKMLMLDWKNVVRLFAYDEKVYLEEQYNIQIPDYLEELYGATEIEEKMLSRYKRVISSLLGGDVYNE